MNKQEKSYLEKIYQDVLVLEKQGNLTMSGAGVGNLCSTLLGKRQNRPFRWVGNSSRNMAVLSSSFSASPL